MQENQFGNGQVINNNSISNDELEKGFEILNKIHYYYSERIVGQKKLEKSLIICLIANGHVIIESVPGLAKTTAAKTLTEAINASFARIQCTPDLLPSDIQGTQIFNYVTNTFETKKGPIFANFVLLDEINRSSAKTQSATLEAMQERQVTIDGVKYKLPDVFIVIATQNPIEQEGTYILAEAQLDRFLIKEKLDYPNVNEEIEILKRLENDVFKNSDSILTLDDILFLQNLQKRVYIDDSIKKYIAQIMAATRNPKSFIDDKLASYVELGSSTRGAIAFMECAKALALIRKRNYVIPDDIKELRYCVLRHRISLNFSALADDINVEQIIDAIFGVVPTP